MENSKQHPDTTPAHQLQWQLQRRPFVVYGDPPKRDPGANIYAIIMWNYHT